MLMVSPCLAQHTPVISQYMLNGLPLNPAFAGSRDALSINGSYRNQWLGLDGAPVSQTLGIHTPLRKESIGVGLLLFNDKIGVSSQTGVYGIASYRLKLKKGKLSFGLTGGLTMSKNNWDNIDTSDDNDFAFSGGNEQFFLPNMGAGIYYYTKKYYASLSLPFALTRERNENQEYRFTSKAKAYNLYLNVGYRFKINHMFSILPSVMIKYNATSSRQMDVNAMLEWNSRVQLGFSYRTKDAIISLVRMNINDQFSIGYSFDHTLSELSKYNSGTHEISLQYDFFYKVVTTNPRFF